MAGLPFVAEAAMAKLYASQVAERVEVEGYDSLRQPSTIAP